MNARRNILTGVSVIFSPALSLRSSAGPARDAAHFEEIHPRFAKVKLKSKIKNQLVRAEPAVARKLKIAFTLVELMVSIAILTAVILIVSTLLTNAQRAVGMSQDTIKADADARAIVDRLRADLAALTKEGFLAIYTDTNDRQHLIFTAVGPYRSMTDPTIIANAARIDYGLTGSADKNILWRRAILLNAANTATIANDDHEQTSLASYKTVDRSDIDLELGEFTGTPTMTLPPNSLTEVYDLWPYLARPCTNLKIDWTDGTISLTDNTITWYDADAPKAAWEDHSAADEEYANLAGEYCALWTYEKKDNWPLALRITFTLGEGGTAQKYEIIVDLPR